MEETKSETKLVATRRKPYLRPQMEIVSLRPKETVLGICKSQSLNVNVNDVDLNTCNGAVTICSHDDFV